MSLESFYVSWVDLVVLIVFFWGIRCGRKRGMSEEFLVLAQWLVILLVAGLGYGLLGQLFVQTGFIGHLWANLFAYVGLAILVKCAFGGIRRALGEKLAEREAFGQGEYYLGMIAGGARYLCIVLVAFSILHARKYTSSDRAENKRFQMDNFGSEFFPTPADVQDEVFARSLSGQFAADHFSPLLIHPATKGGPSLRDKRHISARERAWEQILENR